MANPYTRYERLLVHIVQIKDEFMSEIAPISQSRSFIVYETLEQIVLLEFESNSVVSTERLEIILWNLEFSRTKKAYWLR